MTTIDDDDEYTPRCPTCGGRMEFCKGWFGGWYWVCPRIWCRWRNGGHSGY